MWAYSQNKRYNDSLSGYNSLKDPHLNAYFRRPQIRRQLLRANIINKENKIIDEISSTKSLQSKERRQKQQLYHLLEDLVRRNDEAALELVEGGDGVGRSGGKSRHLTSKSILAYSSMSSQEELIRQIKLATGEVGESTTEDSTILQRLDRMIRAIREHEMITSGSSPHLEQHQDYDHHHHHLRRQNESQKKNRTAFPELWSSKSYQDVSGLQQDVQSSKSSTYSSASSPGHLLMRSTSRESRPKSSYGRSRTPSQKHLSTPDLLVVNSNRDDHLSPPNSSSPSSAHHLQRPHSPEVMMMTKSKSCANLATEPRCPSEEEPVLEIESLDGDSLTDESENDLELRESQRFQYLKKTTTFSTKQQQQLQQNGGGKKNFPNTVQQQKGKKNPVKSAARQKVQMTLRYSASGTSKRKRSVKIFQQLAIGGNSILIYDGDVISGDVFSFDIRPLATSNGHSNHHSFSLILFVNGIRDLRINTCCPHKHRPGTRLSPDFTLIDVVGGRPCFACQNLSSVSFGGSNGFSFREQDRKMLTRMTTGGDLFASLSADDYDDDWFEVKAAIESAAVTLAETEKRIDGLLDGGDNRSEANEEVKEQKDDNNDSETLVGGGEEEQIVVDDDDKDSLQLDDDDENDITKHIKTTKDYEQQIEKIDEGETQLEDKIPSPEIVDKVADDEEEININQEEEDVIELIEDDEDNEDDLPSDQQQNLTPNDCTVNLLPETATTEEDNASLSTSSSEKNFKADEADCDEQSSISPTEETTVVENEIPEEGDDDDDDYGSITTITTVLNLANYNLDDKIEEGDISKETLPVEMQLLPGNGLDSDSDEGELSSPSLPPPPSSTAD